MLKKEDSFIILMVIGILLTSIGFFGEFYAILESTFITQIILGSVFVIGILCIFFAIIRRR